MNVVKTSAAAAFIVIAAACGVATEPEHEVRVSLLAVPTEIVLRQGQEVGFQEGRFRLTFLQVLEDSRCPEDRTCVWEGNASIRLGARTGMRPSDLIDLNTALEPRAVEWEGLRVTLEDVLPSRQSDTPPRIEDYSVRLRVEYIE
jgi:hypothetical protein